MPDPKGNIFMPISMSKTQDRVIDNQSRDGSPLRT